ncbi:TolC family protein [Leptospira adleri]|uniref:TolC family protein n=1 Tax=Leptospira adleri TaxID=2023186 RepID=UPI0010843E3B|nr:TolC family protein [Leptospira adleri]TGM52823.1 TolC family protein [Leptospira adleri]
MVSSQNVLTNRSKEFFVASKVLFGDQERENSFSPNFHPLRFLKTVLVLGFLSFVSFVIAPVQAEVIPLESTSATEEDKKKNGVSDNDKSLSAPLDATEKQPAPTSSIPVTFSGKIIDWDVERLTEYAVSNNPLYLSERQNMGIERGKVITASLSRNPIIQFQQQFIGVPGGGSSSPNILGQNGSQGGSTEIAPAMYQDLDVYGVISLRSKVAKKSFEAVLGEFENFDRLFRLRLRQNYWAYLFLTNLVDYNKEFYENYSDLLELTKFRVEKGDISPLEFERLELERIQVEKFYRDALVRRQIVEKELRILSGIRESEGVFAFKSEMKFKSLEDLGLRLKDSSVAAIHRPDIAALEERVKEKKLNIDLQRRESLGYLQVGGEWRIKGNEHYAGVFATIPLPINDRGQGKVLSAKEEHKKFELALEAKKREVNEEIEASKKELLAREDLLAKYERINLLQKNKQLEQKSRIAYVRGASDQVTFLQAEKNYLTVLRDYYEVLYLYYNAVELYKAAVGKKTERD